MKKGTKYGLTRKGWDTRYGHGFDVLHYLAPEEMAYIKKQAGRTRRPVGEVLRAMISYCTADAHEALRQTKIDQLLKEDEEALTQGAPIPVIPRTRTGMPHVPPSPTTPRIHVSDCDDFDTVIAPHDARMFRPRNPAQPLRPPTFPRSTPTHGLDPAVVARYLASW